MPVNIIVGDCRDVLATLPAGHFHTCVTSPPYFGLRDYGVDGQIGLETTPDAYVAEMVAVFREVRRVLRDDATLWLNLGDSYAAARGGKHQPGETLAGGKHGKTETGERVNRGRFDGKNPTRDAHGIGIKHKDLIGIPWMVARALQQPFYTGKITKERDRVWLAAIIDGEGTICGFRHDRKDDGRTRTGAHIFVTNSCGAMLDECMRIWPASRHEHMMPSEGHLGNRRVERWIPQGAPEKAMLLAEIYPYLVSKKTQALVAWNLLNFVVDGKRDGHAKDATEIRGKRELLASVLSDLNNGRSVDLPSWLEPIPSLFEPGWYLRQDIIWHKPNPMPESVRDRCTKAHEYLFLLSKSPRYFFDQATIAEPAKYPGDNRAERNDTRKSIDPFCNDNGSRARTGKPVGETVNRRSVWTVTTWPFKGAHFATFPPALVEPCILAGCPSGGNVLDPFGGAGTTGLVANRLKRSATLIELNPEYRSLAIKRILCDGLDKHLARLI